MAVLSSNSKKILATCDPKIQLVFNEAIKDTPIDFKITCGYRGELEQNEAFAKGFSKVKYPNGKHNKVPSQAIDVVPFPKMWDAPESEFKKLSYHIKNTAKRLGVNLKWGGDWRTFKDKPHYEL